MAEKPRRVALAWIPQGAAGRADGERLGELRRHGPALGMFVEVTDEPVDASRRELDVGVQDEEEIAGGVGEGAVVALAEAEVGRMSDETHAAGKWLEAGEGVVVAGVVDDDHVEGKAG
jgi:hypothetical protein